MRTLTDLEMDLVGGGVQMPTVNMVVASGFSLDLQFSSPNGTRTSSTIADTVASIYTLGQNVNAQAIAQVQSPTAGVTSAASVS
jgi:hypothetical protein